jgi:hypothetical protein
MACEQPPACERAERDSPDAIVAFLAADIFPGTGAGDGNPWAVPPDAPVGADVAHLEAVGIVERGQWVGHLPGRGLIAGGGGAQIERFVRPLLVERFTAVIERPLWGAQGGAGRSGGVGVQGAMPPFVAAVLVRCAGCEALRSAAQAHPPRRQLG